VEEAVALQAEINERRWIDGSTLTLAL